MVNAQQYLNQNYSKEIKEIDLSDKNLEGSLVINGFSNLKTIKFDNNKDLENIELVNLPELNYFRANNCQLTGIKVNSCPKIKDFNVSNNLLTTLNFLDGLNPKKLTSLSIHSNNFSEQTLKTFSKFTNLQKLYLDNCDKAKFRKGIYNRFFGSLKPLQNLTKLEILGIGATDIDSGLEYLPKSLRKVGLDSSIKADTGCSRIIRELEEAAEIERVTEKLHHHEEGDEP
jgi:hypothetical protein